MNTPELNLLSPEQVAFLEDHQEVLEALLNITEQSDFKPIFGEMMPGEMASRYINTLNYDGNESWEQDIGERFRQVKQREANGDHSANWGTDLDALEAKYRK
ncbi:MAG TPA: hypothetical protein VLK33_04075 [Terriglobales bacterium]|nr:hypothetical protein [Terriglobales bacterium]